MGSNIRGEDVTGEETQVHVPADNAVHGDSVAESSAGLRPSLHVEGAQRHRTVTRTSFARDITGDAGRTSFDRSQSRQRASTVIDSMSMAATQGDNTAVPASTQLLDRHANT